MKKKPGFTLIELLIVVAIIAILAAIAVPNFLEAQTRAKLGRAKAEFRSLRTALESYAVDNSVYPNGEAVTSLLIFQSNLNGSSIKSDFLKCLTTPVAYMTSLPAQSPFGKWGSPAFVNFRESFDGYQYVGGKIAKTWIGGPNYNYYLRCMGPTKVLSGGNVPYDPTNGTVSHGDLVYLAGSGPLATYYNSLWR
jgi:type II secretion system protein G